MGDFFSRTAFPFEPRFIRELRKRTQPPFRKNVAFAAVISRRFSIYFSALFIRLGVHPDTITLFMVFFGIAAAAALFAKLAVASVVLFNLWFIIDCSDGEVARHRGKLNPLGSTIDLMAHIINHPLLIAGFAFYLKGRTPDLVYIAALLLAVSDLTLRLMNYLPDGPQHSQAAPKANREYHIAREDGFSLKMTLMRLIIEFPNFLLLATFTMIFDRVLAQNTTYWLFLFYAFANFAIVSIVQAKKIRRLIWNI